MIVTCVHIHIKKEFTDAFVDATVLNRQGTIKEAGNLRFDFLQQSDDHCRFMLFEVFESEDAVDLHKTTDHYIKWRDTVKEMMADTRYGIRYNVIEPEKISEW